MKLVLLSGGSGKRLWPLSNDSRSKQFLKVLENDKGTLSSMVQRVWGQLITNELAESTVIATSKSQFDMIQNQLHSQADLIVEPNRRDTFPAIALAASYLYSVKSVDLDEVIAILPVDPYVEDHFFDKIKELQSVLAQSDADLALIGVTPTYPSSKYGYIVSDNEENSWGYMKVKRFTEKPSEIKAKTLIDEGALWNCGVFAFKLSYIINYLEQNSIPIEYHDLIKNYSLLPKISFDYEIVEKAEKIIVLPYKGYWKDLGTWNTLTEEMATNQIGNGIISKDSMNTHLINELDIPVSILGLSNVVVAVSPDGILVADKEASPRIKELLGDDNNRPMYEERRWGWYRVLDYTKFQDGNEVLTKRIGITAGRNFSYQFHQKRSEVWTIVKGEGIFALNGKLTVVRPGDVLQVNSGDHHALKAISELEFIEVQNGTELIEEDIVRLFLEWDEIENHCYSLTKK